MPSKPSDAGPYVTPVALRRLSERRGPTGFLRMDDRHGFEPSVFWSADIGMERVPGARQARSIPFVHGGATYRATLLLHAPRDRHPEGKAQSFVSVLQDAQGKVVAYVSGALVTSRGFSTPLGFVDCADGLNEDALFCADALLDQATVAELFGDGNVLMVTLWERSGAAPAGTGLAALRALAASLAARKARIGTLCLLLDAQQYADLADDVRMADAGFLSAMAKVHHHLATARVGSFFGERTRTLYVEPRPTSGAAGGLGILAKHMAAAQAAGAGVSAPPAAPDVRIHKDNFAESVRIDAGESGPVGERLGYPDDFDARHAVETMAFGPHPRFWNFMPSEMTSLEVAYVPGKAGMASRPATLRVGFVNGAAMEFDASYLPGGDAFGRMVPALVGADDFVMRRNAYAERLGAAALGFVLTRNLLLAFDGEGPTAAGDHVLARSLRQ